MLFWGTHFVDASKCLFTGTQKTNPGTQKTNPGTQQTIPSIQKTNPSTQLTIPSSSLTNPGTRPQKHEGKKYKNNLFGSFLARVSWTEQPAWFWLVVSASSDAAEPISGLHKSHPWFGPLAALECPKRQFFKHFFTIFWVLNVGFSPPGPLL